MARTPLSIGRGSRSILLIWLVLLLLLAGSLLGQRHRFRYYTHRDGLKDTEVHCLLQDRTGFIWVGTATGLFRYDGSRFASFAVPGPANIIEALAETPDGTLWVGTSVGLARMHDGQLQVVDPPGWVGVSGPESLLAGSDGKLYVGTSKGLYVGEPAGSKYTFHLLPNPQPGTDPTVYGVHRDPGGTIWLGCGEGLCTMNSKGIEVLDGVPEGRWEAILTDRKGNLWIRSARRLMVRPSGAQEFKERDRGLAQAAIGVVSLQMDRDGRLFASSEAGLSFLNGDEWETIGIDQGLPTNPTCCILQDREGSIWVGLAGAGLARWRGYERWQSWTRTEGLAGSNLQAIHRDIAGNLWVGTENGVQRFHGNGKVSKVWTEKDGLGGRRVRAITSTADGAIWVGSSPGGVSRLEPGTGKIRHYELGTAAEDNLVTGMTVDQEGRIWVTTQGALFRSQGHDAATVFENQVPPFSSAAETFGQVLVDGKGRWWLAGSLGLLEMENGKWTRFSSKDGMVNDAVDSVAETTDGSIWISYSDAIGVSRLSFEHGIPRWRHFSEKNGLKSDEIAALAADTRGWLWATSNDGVDAFDGQKWRHFSQAEGLLWDDCVGRSLYGDRDGSVWIGTSRGISHYLPPAHQMPDVAPPVVITSVRFGSTRSSRSPVCECTTKTGLW